MIGGAFCDVVGATETAIECAVGEGPMGEYAITVTVEGKGDAAYPDGMFKFVTHYHLFCYNIIIIINSCLNLSVSHILFTTLR